MLLFRCATGEAWPDIMLAVLSVIMDNFDYLTRDTSILGSHHLGEFITTWSEFDPSGIGRIHYTEVFNLLRSIDPPLGFGKKCPERMAFKKLIRMNMPMDTEGKVHFTTTLFALIREHLKINVRESSEMDQADIELRTTIIKCWPHTKRDKIDLLVPTAKSTGKGYLTVGKLYGGVMIHNNWCNTKFGQIEVLRRQEAELEALQKASDIKNGIIVLEDTSPSIEKLEKGNQLTINEMEKYVYPIIKTNHASVNLLDYNFQQKEMEGHVRPDSFYEEGDFFCLKNFERQDHQFNDLFLNKYNESTFREKRQLPKISYAYLKSSKNIYHYRSGSFQRRHRKLPATPSKLNNVLVNNQSMILNDQKTFFKPSSFNIGYTHHNFPRLNDSPSSFTSQNDDSFPVESTNILPSNFSPLILRSSSNGRSLPQIPSRPPFLLKRKTTGLRKNTTRTDWI
ncbi:CACNA1B [Lepeophtheirus salmonis]|uniref:CACNA1B n=1 Tax=Lepeophtheirus salmonis TaxID=72036 RepID=A0A7R8H2X8_LEPSM|nr:CACNA1B [Lepeophtheirus salmonis]CAF2820608.1 CACNA1B [Lepeophtheirus salmonis]